MSNLIEFFIRHKITLLFLFLLSISLGLTFQSHSFQRSKFVSSTNYVSGTLHSWNAGMRSYFRLKGENNQLLKENRRLREQLYNADFLKDSVRHVWDTTFYDSPYKIQAVQVI